MATTPTLEWTRLLGTSNEDVGYALTTGLDGAIYMIESRPVPRDSQTNSGDRDVFLTKFR